MKKAQKTKTEKKNYVETYVIHCATKEIMKQKGFEFKYDFNSTSEKEKYEAEKAKALADFKKAQDYLKQAAAVEPTNEAVKETQKQVADAIAPLVEKK